MLQQLPPPPRILLLFLGIITCCLPCSSQVITEKPDIFLPELEFDSPINRGFEAPCDRYTELGSTVRVWDWRAPEYTIHYRPSNGTAITEEIDSPFFVAGDNINHLGFDPTGGPRDFQPEDGWELLYRRFGTPERPTREPTFGLYNRLDGRVRIFFYLEPDDGNAPDNVLIRMAHELLIDGNTSSIFEHMNMPMGAASNFSSGLSYAGMAQLNKGVSGPEWYILEGSVSYDPCACQHESSLRFEPVLTDITKTTFTMEGTGVSTATYDAGEPISTLGFFNGLSNKITGGYKKYKDFTDYKKDADKNSNKTVSVLSSALNSFTQGVAGVGLFTDILGFVLGKKSTASPPKLTGFNHNFTFEGVGENIGTNAYAPYFMYNPGSPFNPRQLQANQPVYDNPLGVMAVLRPPTVEWEVANDPTQGNGIVVRWRYAGDLQYHINTIAGLSRRPTRLMAALVWPDCTVGKGTGFYATPMVNITCLEEYVAEFAYNGFDTEPDPGSDREVDIPNLETDCPDPPQLQIMAILQPEGGASDQEVIYSARYTMRPQRARPGTIGPNPFEDLQGEAITQLCADIPVTPPPPVDNYRLNQFCSLTYNPRGDEKQSFTESIGEANENTDLSTTDLKAVAEVYPNPFGSRITLANTSQWRGQTITLELRNLIGESVWQQKGLVPYGEPVTLPHDFSQLTPGVYYLLVSTGQDLETYPLIKR